MTVEGGGGARDGVSLPLVSVCVVNWNTRQYLERCLEALVEQDHGFEIEVVVVDNGSSDDSVEMVRTRFPGVRLIALDENLGFAGGNNVAFEAARGDFLLVMNPDVYVQPGSIRRCREFLQEHPEAGAVGAVLEGTDGRIQSEFFRRFPSRTQITLFYTLLVYAAQRLGSLRRRFFEHDVSGTEPIEVDQVPGAFCMVRRSVIDTCGPMDPDYFIWFEDVDWCYRMRQAGYSLYALPNARGVHAGGASFEGWSLDRRISQFYRSMFRFFAKHDLDQLLRWGKRVLVTDLYLKEWLVRVVGGLHLKPRSALPTPASLRSLRTSIRSLVRQHEAGELVKFADSEVARVTIQDEYQDHVDVVVVNWNGVEFLPRCLAALDRSTTPTRVIVVDNASSDGSRSYLERNPDSRTYETILLPVNVGYAEAANRGLTHGDGTFALVMNPDVVLAPDHLEHLVTRAREDSGLGVAQGKLFSASRDAFLSDQRPRNRIDSAGHVMSKTRMVFDRGQGRRDEPALSREASVFSASGAAIFLRRSMLAELSPHGSYFDDSFFAYKEDIDLCWRARLLGWDVRYVPDAEGWHVRSWSGTSLPPRDRVPLHARRASWANHWMMILKNDNAMNMIRHLPWIAGWEVVRLGYALLRDPGLLPVYVTALKRVRDTLDKRRAIQGNRRTSPREMRRWFGGVVIEHEGVAESVRAGSLT